MKLRHLVLLAGLVAGGNAPVPAAASDGLLAGPPERCTSNSTLPPASSIPGSA